LQHVNELDVLFSQAMKTRHTVHLKDTPVHVEQYCSDGLDEEPINVLLPHQLTWVNDNKDVRDPNEECDSQLDD